MRCFYIGDFVKSHSTENYVVHGLEENGVEVIKWQENKEAPLIALLEHIESLKPDFVLFSKNRLWSNGKQLIDRLKKKGILTASWLFDLYLDLPPEMGSNRSIFDSPFRADLVFTSDGGHLDAYKQKGINAILLRQGIHEPEAKILPPTDLKFDVAFIGSATYSKRLKLIQFLERTYGRSFCHFGIGGNANEVRNLHLNQVVASVKIVVGDSVPYPHYWSNRIYEMLGRGAFFLHPAVEGLDKEFQPYKHYIPFEYGNMDQLKEIIDYYLTHDKEREKIRLAGHEFCKANYTYTHRVRDLIAVIKDAI